MFSKAATSKPPRRTYLCTPQESCDVRTPLTARFSNFSDEGGERRIHDRMPDDPFQPASHGLFFERSTV